MNYHINQVLTWIPIREFSSKQGEVTVVEIRSRGQAKLSNGFVVDEDGYAEGSKYLPGGHVTNPP